MEIPEAPTLLAGGWLGGHVRASPVAAGTRGNRKRRKTEPAGYLGAGVNEGFKVGGVEELADGRLKLLLALLLEGWVLAE